MQMRFFVVAAIIIGSQLHAQDSTSLDEVVLTANKYPKKQTETGKVVTVINRAQLEKSSGRMLSEVLNTVAGTTSIGANNNPGTNQTVSIRGASSGNVLILIDGIPANDPSVNTNYFDINLIAIDQIERVEILKGGQSTLYGSDAVAGVINIITRKTTAKKISVNGLLTGGSYNTLKQHAGVSGKSKAVNYSLSYTHQSSDGFSAAHDSSGKKNFDKDDFNQHALNGQLGIKLGQKWKARLFGTYSHYNTSLDASGFTDEKDYFVKNDNLQGGAGISYDHKMGTTQFNYNFNYTERDYTDDSIFKSSPFVDWSKARFIGRTHFAELYSNWAWSKWELLLGTDYRVSNTDQFYFSMGSFGPYAPPVLNAKMNQLSPYGSMVYKNGKGFTGEVGARLNIHSEYGGNFSFTLNPSYLVRNKYKFFANLYSAFKTPTLYQLFDPAAGNAELDPEKGLIGEIGTAIYAGGFTGRVVGFYRNTKDAIVYTFNPGTFASKYLNVSEEKNYGAELELAYVKNKWTVNANYTYTDGETTSPYDGTGTPIGKDTTYYNLYRIPKHAINLSVGYQLTPAFFASVQLKYAGDRAEFIYGGDPIMLDLYTTIDIYADYKLSKVFKAFVDLRNIGNKEYFDFLGYNSRKFNFTVGLSFTL